MTGLIARCRSSIWRIVLVGAALAALSVLAACGERSAATSKPILDNVVLTEDDAGGRFELEIFVYDIGLPDKKGLEIELVGDNTSTLRWRFAHKPDPLLIEWRAVDGAAAFETDGLLGNPSTADKTVEFRALAVGEVTAVFELVERDPAARNGDSARRLEYTFDIVRGPTRDPVEPPGTGFRQQL